MTTSVTEKIAEEVKNQPDPGVCMPKMQMAPIPPAEPIQPELPKPKAKLVEGERTVIITGMMGGFDAPVPKGTEIWGCSVTYRRQKNLTKIYWVDPTDYILAPSLHELKKLIDEKPIPIVMQELHPDFPTAELYPLGEVLKEFGVSYFTSSITYMMADAIRQKFDHIIVHRIHCVPESCEYVPQKSCLDFWVGMALGRGIKVSVSNDSHIARPHPWHSDIYGYEDAPNAIFISQFLAQMAVVAKTHPNIRIIYREVGKRARYLADELGTKIDFYDVGKIDKVIGTFPDGKTQEIRPFPPPIYAERIK